jgi:hypothetical protein
MFDACATPMCTALLANVHPANADSAFDPLNGDHVIAAVRHGLKVTR